MSGLMKLAATISHVFIQFWQDCLVLYINIYINTLINTLSIWGMDAFNILRLWTNRHYFADDIFKYIFLNVNELILIKISLKFFSRGSD